MAQKTLQLKQGMFFGDGLHLVFPEKPIVILPDTYKPGPQVLRALKVGQLVDVYRNILEYDDAPKTPEAPKEPEAPPTPVVPETPAVPETPVVTEPTEPPAVLEPVVNEPAVEPTADEAVVEPAATNEEKPTRKKK